MNQPLREVTLCLFVKLAIHLSFAFVLLSLLFVVAAVWRIKMYIYKLKLQFRLFLQGAEIDWEITT